MFKQVNMGVTTYICSVCGRIEPTPPPWASRDRRRAERRDTKTFSEAMSFKRVGLAPEDDVWCCPE